MSLSLDVGTGSECAVCVIVFLQRFRGATPEFHSDSVGLVRERTIPTERPPLVGEVSAERGAADPYGRNLGFLDRRVSFYKKNKQQTYSMV
jgi:hypothetical protein